jgi:hypothetical protein
MKRKLSLLFLLAAAVLFVAFPAVAGKRYNRCVKDCKLGKQECAKACERMKDPNDVRRCKEKGCKMYMDECLKRCERKRGK